MFSFAVAFLYNGAQQRNRVRFNDQIFKVCINSDVVTSFAASHTVSASEFGRLKANDRNQGPFVKETSCHKLASYSGPRISEVTHAPLNLFHRRFMKGLFR